MFISCAACFCVALCLSGVKCENVVLGGVYTPSSLKVGTNHKMCKRMWFDVSPSGGLVTLSRPCGGH